MAPRSVIHPRSNPVSGRSKKQTKPSLDVPNAVPKFTLEEAFDYEPHDSVGDVTKGTLAVAYLLDSVSNFGNDPIEGQLAQGLAFALRHYAKDVRDLLAPRAPYNFVEAGGE